MPNRIRDSKNYIRFFIDCSFYYNNSYCILCTRNSRFLHPSGCLKKSKYFYKTYREAIGVLKKYIKIQYITRSTHGTHNTAYANLSAGQLNSTIS